MTNAFVGIIRSVPVVTAMAVASILAVSAPTSAQAADKIKVVETIKLDAPVAKVWSVVGNFAALDWHPAVKSTTATAGNTPGSQRSVDLGGPILVEKLLRRSEKKNSLTYAILDNGTNQKILPVKGYISNIQVKKSGDGSVVVWSSKFEAAPGTDPAAAKKAIQGVYRGGLDNLPKVVAKP